MPNHRAPRRPSVPRYPHVSLLSVRAILALVLAAVVALVVVVVGRTGHRTGGYGVDAESANRALHISRPACGYSTLLVPKCGRWWGMAPLAFTTTPITEGVHLEEAAIGRPLDIVHVYHHDGQLFPTEAERGLAMQDGSSRLLLINWKPATDMTWRAVADGGADARIDTLAAYIKQNFHHRFFLTIWHEPENDVVPAAGSGMTASDYAAMFRHVVRRLRADGMTWAVTVMNYMGFDKWAQQSWFAKLWPGDDVVNWIGLDPYGTGATSGYNARDFATLVNRPEGRFPGYYTWATTRHRGKPIMLAEWGIQAVAANPSGQAKFFANVSANLRRYPQIKALVYYDMPTPPPGGPVTSLRANSRTLTAFRALGRTSAVVAPRVGYGR